MGKRRWHSSDHKDSGKSACLLSSSTIISRPQQQQPGGSSIPTSHKRQHASCPVNNTSLPTDTPQSKRDDEAKSANYRLRQCVEEMRRAPLDADQVGLTYSLHYAKMREECMRLCEKLATTTNSNNNSNRDISGAPLSEQQQQQLYTEAIRHWQSCQVALLGALRTSLLEAYREADPSGATVRGFEMLCANRSARRVAVRKIQQQYLNDAGASHQQQQQQQQQQPKRSRSLPPLFTEESIVSPDRDDGSSNQNGEVLTAYEVRFTKYDLVLADLAETRQRLRGLTAESGSGIPIRNPAANVREYAISPRGDVVLEFASNRNANAAARTASGESLGPEPVPVLRFRVSSHMLAEVSPVFASIFALYSSGDHHHEKRNSSGGLDKSWPPPPLPPTRHTCSDGTEADLYRMAHWPETNAHRSLEVVLHAAHHHHNEPQIPRDVGFDQFVAIAWVCWRYRCTSPLELVVEHRWLPQWLHLSVATTTTTTLGTAEGVGVGVDGGGIGERDGGLLMISYVFGARLLFTRITKSIILNVVDEHELYAKDWPAAVKEKILAVRQAKIDQVYACCSGALQEYLRPPCPPPPSSSFVAGAGDSGNARASVFKPTSTPRCPKGSHAYDAASLGWLMKTFAELEVLPHVMPSANVVGHLPPPPRRSLCQLIDALGFMPSPPPPHDGLHDDNYYGGVCDYASALRSAINDVYNSVSGLTLYDVAGRHGWGISRHRHNQPQPTNKMQIMPHYHARSKGPDAVDAAVAREAVELRILSLLDDLDDLDDLHAAAMVNRSFYDTYKRNELLLMRGILKREAMMRRSDASSLVSSSPSSSITMGRAGRAQALGATGVIGGGGYWRKSSRPYRAQEESALDNRCYTVVEIDSSASTGNSIPVTAAEERFAAPAAADAHASYFKLSDDDDDGDNEEPDAYADATEGNNWDGEEGNAEHETQEDAVPVSNQDRTHSKKDEPRAIRSMTPKNGNDSRASPIRIVTREEAERILWPPAPSPPSPQRRSTDSTTNGTPTSSSRSLASLPPSYTFAAREMDKAAAATPKSMQQGSHDIPEGYEHPPQQRESTPAAAGPGGGGREKFLAADGLGFREHKSLMPSENKHLRETHERLVGIHVDADDK